MKIKLLAAAAALASSIGAAQAAPLTNPGVPAATGDDAVTQVQYVGCYPVYRQVWDAYYGMWRTVYVGTRCPTPVYSYPYPYTYGPHIGIATPGLRIGIGF
jgi:hypothetical protein